MKSKYNFNNLFLDDNYLSLLESYCLKRRLVERYAHGEKISNIETAFNKVPLKGIKKLFILLTLFDKIDSSESLYNFERLIDLGFIRPDCHLHEIIREDNSKFEGDSIDNDLLKSTIDLMELYKEDIINEIKRKNKDCTSFYCINSDGRILSLNKDYSEIVKNSHTCYPYTHNFDNLYKRMSVMISNCGIDNEIQILRNNIMQGIYYSRHENSTFASSLFRNIVSSSVNEKLDMVYYTVRTQLPKEINILPMPQTIEDVIKMRNSPYLISFKEILNEWLYYVENGDINLSQKIQSDVIKANQNLERLDKYKKFANSPYFRVFNLIGGQIPIISTILNIHCFSSSFIEDAIQQKNEWILLPSN
jgi:hypothetical protein